jgi:hypothetical protein
LFLSLAAAARRTSKHCRDAPGLIPYDAHDVAAELSLFIVHNYAAHDDARIAVG